MDTLETLWRFGENICGGKKEIVVAWVCKTLGSDAFGKEV